MTLPANYRCLPNEVLILKNSMGGRRFVVHSQTDDGVVELHSLPCQQKYVQATDPRWLIKIGSIPETDKTLATLRSIYDKARNDIAKREQERDASFRALFGLHEPRKD